MREPDRRGPAARATVRHPGHPLQGTGREGQRPLAVVLLGAVVAADQVLKLLVERRLALGERIPLLPWLALTHVHNRGIAFSLLETVSWILPAGIALTLLFLLFYNKARWMRAPLAPWAMALLAGGAIGNLLDRLRVGAVIDYVDLSIWPVFNLADVAVTLGAGLLVLTLLRPDRTLARGD